MVTRPGDSAETSLEAAMRAPSTISPDVVVLGYIEEERKAKDMADPKKDLWLSTVDGYMISPDLTARQLANTFSAAILPRSYQYEWDLMARRSQSIEIS